MTTLLVFGDSLSYYGPGGGLPADDPRIWPVLTARALGWELELAARIGWTNRDAYWALIQDPRVWAAIGDAGAVVIATGGMDTLPSPLPTALREQIRYLRPPALRRTVRKAYQWVQPRAARLGRPVALPPRVSVDYLEQLRASLVAVRPELPIVATLPPTHRAPSYGYVHSGWQPARDATGNWVARNGLPVVDLGDIVLATRDEEPGNPDGMHWSFATHRAVAEAVTAELQ